MTFPTASSLPEPDGTDAQLLQLFAVPLVLVEHVLDEAANAELAEWALLERELGEGVQRSIVGGWHSKPDLPRRGVLPLDAFFGTLIEHVQNVHARLGTGADYEARFLLQAWATVLERGHYVQVHDHADAHWSAVYYVDAGDGGDAASGRISWINPVGSHRSLPGMDLIPTTFSVTPRTGLLAIFPGWLRHSVEPYQGERPRIVIAANIEVQRLAR